jgi:hypothetical protein
MLSEERLLHPRSIVFDFIQEVVTQSQSFLKFGSRLSRKFISGCLSLVINETRSHLKNYHQLKDRKLKVVCFYEFEFLMSMLNRNGDYLTDDNYKRVHETFNDLAAETVDSQKLMKFYRVMLKSMHLRYQLVFNVNSVLSNI